MVKCRKYEIAANFCSLQLSLPKVQEAAKPKDKKYGNLRGSVRFSDLPVKTFLDKRSDNVITNKSFCLTESESPKSIKELNYNDWKSRYSTGPHLSAKVPIGPRHADIFQITIFRLWRHKKLDIGNTGEECSETRLSCSSPQGQKCLQGPWIWDQKPFTQGEIIQGVPAVGGQSHTLIMGLGVSGPSRQS